MPARLLPGIVSLGYDKSTSEVGDGLPVALAYAQLAGSRGLPRQLILVTWRGNRTNGAAGLLQAAYTCGLFLLLSRANGCWQVPSAGHARRHDLWRSSSLIVGIMSLPRAE